MFTAAVTCSPLADTGAVPVLPEGFTRCDAAQFANAAALFGVVAAGLVVFLLAVIAVRGR